MADTFVTYTGDGSNTDFAIPFPYIDGTHVKIFVNDVEELGWSFISSGIARMDTAPAAGATVKVQRVTPRASPLVDFEDTSTLTEADLDLAFTQAIYVIQEAYDNLGAEAQAAIAADKAEVAASAVLVAADRAATEAAYDLFDDRFLGAKAADPTLDNDGNALATGTLYWDTTNGVLKAFNGTTWESYGTAVQAAGDTMTGQLTLPGGGSGNHAATVNEVAARVAKSGDTMTGFLTLHANPTANLHAATKQYVDGLASGVSGAIAAGNPQSVPNETWTALSIDTAVTDPSSWVSTATDRITAPTTGWYVAIAEIASLSSMPADSRLYGGVYVNGSRIWQDLRKTGPSADDETANPSGILYLTANDYVQFWAYHRSGAARNMRINRCALVKIG